MVVCVECLPADKPWGVVSATRRSSDVAPRACARVYARVLVPPNIYIHAHIQIFTWASNRRRLSETMSSSKVAYTPRELHTSNEKPFPGKYPGLTLNP